MISIQYLVDLDKNIAQYNQEGSGPSKVIGAGECDHRNWYAPRWMYQDC